MERTIYQDEVDNNDEKILNPYQYFHNLKGKVQEIDCKKLNEVYKNAIYLAETYKKTGQKKGLRKLNFHLESIMKEKEVIQAGITKFIYKDDIEEYIENVASKQVVILDIANYERIIPDEIVDIMEKVKDLFDEFYVVCTDYNGKLSKKINKERREKDPILFGVFLDRNKQAINERFYYIGDWVDEYCDLTLDKMVSEMKSIKGRNISQSIEMPNTLEELKEQLNKLQLQEEIKDNVTQISLISSAEDLVKKEKKNGLFQKVKTFLGVKNDK